MARMHARKRLIENSLAQVSVEIWATVAGYTSLVNTPALHLGFLVSVLPHRAWFVGKPSLTGLCKGSRSLGNNRQGDHADHISSLPGIARQDSHSRHREDPGVFGVKQESG
jgi:hypothetical protein